MLTILLAWINAKYNHEYEVLFLATLIIDVSIINMIENIL